MDVRAAVGFEAGKKLPIETVQLRGAKEGFQLMARDEGTCSVVVY